MYVEYNDLTVTPSFGLLLLPLNVRACDFDTLAALSRLSHITPM